MKPSQTQFKLDQTNVNGLDWFQVWFVRFWPQTGWFGFRLGKFSPKPNQTELQQHYQELMLAVLQHDKSSGARQKSGIAGIAGRCWECWRQQRQQLVFLLMA